MAPLTHPSIRDGWFREINSQWPGAAMTLKVQKILHVEQSLYQDVLVFESSTYGNVLVLDGVIQVTERDEFSYQEMIAHLPLASHPNPKKVLVIGGGDGGVVREVLKHASVEEVVLCDIDEAVIRVSKKYLPHMAGVLSSPRVRVFVGDGFKFLEDNKATYDVIITDSSDPVGPAATLFQTPYFQLIYNALAPGGHSCSQGECLWNNVHFIHNLRQSMQTIFPVAEYSYTTIPTYPSGQIGFIMGAKAEGRDLKTPLRTVPDCRYYNEQVHKVAFVLPEFGRALLEEGKSYLTDLGDVEVPKDIQNKKKILLLGTGFVARPCAEYLIRNPANELTVASTRTARGFANGLRNTTAVSIDVNDTNALEALVAAHDLVISLIPYIYHPAVIKAAIKGKTNVVTTSYISPAIKELEAEVKAAGIVVMNEIGLDPGIDHLYAVKTIGDVHSKGGKVKEFYSYAGGLPAPECADNPLGYKFAWSSRGVLLALLNNASYISNGTQIDVAGSDLMNTAKPYYISPAFAFVAYPNRNSVPFREFYDIPEAQTVLRGTLRYQGFPEFIDVLVKLGWLDMNVKTWLKDEMTWAQVTQQAIGANDSSEASLISRIDALCSFPDSMERNRIITGLRWMGLFSEEQVKTRAGNLLDTLCAQLETLMKYEKGERDFIMLQHKFVVEWPNGKENTITSTLEAYGDPTGYSAMAQTVGVPCAIATQFILDGKLEALKTPGIYAPYSKDICDPIREALEAEGIGMIEKIL